ncbi:MAG TPA: adenylate/guanylate cyclase domain-containing protein, partial [Steroidobacteraceae bacterium]|nr:adenylate/guanylate cyclase domain-containing protein [Steroidobacteraceae bacterium]
MTMTADNNSNSAKTVGGGLFNRYILKPSADRWAQPAAADELTSLDDHTLKVMGIARYEIPGIVAAEMAPQAAANEEDPPQPINARRAMTQSGHAPRGHAPSAEESSMSRSLILHPASRTGQRSFPMPPVRAERKLAAILAADVTGYSRLMGADEEGALARLKAHRRELIDPKIEEHRGRIVKTTGDGILVEFPSVVDAVRCAVETQEGMVARNADVPQDCRIDLRVGVNLGDIIVEGDDIHGDGVNIAARLEGLAEPGGICISQTVLNLVSGKVPFEVEDAGEQALKNIDRPVHVYRINMGSAARRLASPEQALPLPDKPSIVVLPFVNLSGDPEQEYFADGMVEDIITALSRMRWLFVIARNSSFAYKGRAVDARQVARELGVRYVLEGSVRKTANRLRIAGQLIDGSTGAHLWADRFEGALEDIFDLQDQMTASVVGAIAPRLEQAEIERAKRKPTESLDAYDCHLRGMASLYQWTKEGTSEALRMFYRAIELDPDFASAYGTAAWCYVLRESYGWMTDRAEEIAETARLARRAVELGREDAAALSTSGMALAYVVGDLDDGAAFIDRALALNPNLAAAWYYSGWARIWLGEPDSAIEPISRAMRLSPLDPLINRMH